MKKLYILACILMPMFAWAQNQPNALAVELNSWLTHPAGVKQIQPFKVVAEDPLAAKDVLGATYFQIDPLEMGKIWDQHLGAYQIKVPYEGRFLSLMLFETTQNDLSIDAPVGAINGLDPGKSFRGILEGDQQSVVGISFFRNGDIYGIVSDKTRGNIVIGQLKNQPKNATPTYVVYEEQKLKVGNPFTCVAANQIPEENEIMELSANLRGENLPVGKCVRIGFLVTYPMYSTRFGSNSTTATNYVRALSNNMGAIYALHNVHQKIGNIFIFTTAAQDTFNYNTSVTALESFGWSLPANYMPNSDLFHLLHPGLGGGVAWVNVLCNAVGTYNGSPYDYRTAVSGALGSSITPLPTYSWEVEVCTHEMGHNIGSPHTHACNWNGANTKIDDCGTNAGYSEGNCPPAPGLPPANTGTVMSYCHLVSTGINFAYGFGPQPGDLIDSKVNNGACFAGCCSAGISTSVTPDTCVTAGTSVTITASGAQVYAWKYDNDTYSYGNTFTVTVNNYYEVTVTGYTDGDCQGEQVIKIRVKPSAPAIANLSRMLCQNAADTISPTAGRICQVLPKLRITEIHYDNVGTDANEFIEVGGPAGTDLSCYKIVFYNGNTPTAAVGYDSITLSGTIDNENGCGYGAKSFLRAGIQNGPNDGMALLYRQSATCPNLSDLDEFLSYEGVITAASGWAKNLVSKNLPVSENGTEPLGQSLQLINGAWVGPLTDSRDSLQTSAPCFNFYASNPALGNVSPFYSGPFLAINGTSSPINTGSQGTFNVWVTNRSSVCGDNNTCESAATIVSYTISPLNPGISASQNPICTGGSSTLSVTGGTFANYLWSTGDTTATISVAPSVNTTYTVSVSDGGVCTGTASIAIVVGSSLSPMVSVTPSFLCSGGDVQVAATAGYSSYSWSSGQNTSSFTQNVTSTTTFTVTVSDGTCTGTGSATVTVGGSFAPSITANPSGAVCAGTQVTLGTSISYSSYNWSNGQTTSTINVTPNSTTSYSVTVVDAGGCTGTATRTVTVNPLPAPSITGNLSICQGSATTLSTTLSYSGYAWSTGATTQSILVAPSSTSTYKITVTDGNGCTATDSATVTVINPTAVSINASPASPVCAGTNCAFSTTPNNFAGYSWSNGQTSASFSQVMNSTTTFAVTCTGTNGCASIATYQMIVNTPPTPPSLLSSDNPVEVCLGGIDTIKPIADSTLPVVTNVIISEFHYDNIGTDANEFIEIAGPAGTDLSCYTIQLYNGSNNPSIATLYDTKVLTGAIDNEGNGFGAVDFVYPVNGIQNGATDGIALIYVNSATCPNATTVVQFISYEGGPIIASGGFANGATSTPIPVQEDPAPGVGTSLQYNFSTNVWTGPLNASHQGSLPKTPVTFNYYAVNPVPGPATPFRTDSLLPIGPNTTPIGTSTAGMYMVWVTKVANGCESAPTKTVVNVFGNINPVIVSAPASPICAGTTTSLSTTTSFSTYLWSTGETSSNINVTPLTTTIYAVTVQDARGCLGTDTITITVLPVPAVGAQTNRTFCSGLATGGIVFSSTVSGTTFNWTNTNALIGIGASGVGNIPSWIPVNNTAANIVGTITVTPVVTTNGVSCSGAPITFTITILPAPKAMCKNFTLNLDASGNGTLNPNDINNGSVGGTLTISKSSFNCGNIGANNVTLTVTDVCGQTNTCVAVVTVADNVPPVITCPKSIVETLAPGECNKAVGFENPTAKDNCELGFTPAVITTTFASNNQFAGNMFNVTNNTTQPITLTSFEGNVAGAVGLPVSFQIFYTTTAATYVGNETNAAAWTSMGTANSTCAGLNNPTIVPIGGLTIQPGQTKGIYFVLTSYNIATNSLRYTNGNNVYNNGDMTITAGVGKATPNFTGTTFLSRIWNGRIRYNKVTAAPPTISQIDNTGFKNGDIFPKGTTCLVYQARDFAGNLSATCQVCIEIRGITNPTSTITCNDLSNVSLDTNCLAFINADMILEGGPYDCYSDYKVILTLNGKVVPNPITAEYAGKTLTATVIDKFSINKCWGLLKIEDKVLPQIVCPPSVTISCAVSSDPGNIGAVFPNGLRFGTFEQYSDPTTGVNVYRFGDKKYRVKAGLVDKCSEVILTYNDVVQEFTCAASTLITKIISRKWAATDIYGNSTNCTQTISVRRAVLTELVMPRNWDGQVNNDRVLNLCKDMYSGDPNDYFHLDTAWVKLSNGNASPKAGVNAVDTILVGEFDPFHDPLNPGTDTLILRGTGMPAGATCGTINMLYTDTKVQVCEDGYKLIRDWRILDWCTGQTRNYTQLIIVVDKTAPTLVCPVDLTASTDALDCKGSGVFPAPTITDICSPASLTYEVTYRGGTPFTEGGYIGRNADGSWRYSGLSCGTYNFKYTAKDGCGNVDSCITFDLIIRDLTVPVPVCRSVTQVTLSNTPDDPNTVAKECGLTRVEGFKFDEGSWDNCGQVHFKVRRANTFNPGIYDNDPRFEDNVWFNCEDVGKDIDVILRVYDVQPLLGHVGSVSDRGDSYRPTRTDGCGPLGNFNDCVVKVRVEDLVNPTITCPPQLNMTCTAYDFSIPLTNADTSWFNKYLGKVVTADCNGNNTAGSFTYFNGNGQVTGSNGLAFDNCFVSIPQTISAQLECGVGTITRTFRALDRGGRQSNPCTQLIVVTNPTPFTINASHYTDPGSDLADPCDGAERIRLNANEDFVNDLYVSPNFSPDNIIWPDKVVELTSCTGIDSIGTECANTGKDAGRPRILRNDKCDLVAITFTDEVFPIAAPACVKILRTWRVIDWCQNKPTGRIWTYTQIIKLVNKVAPEFTGNTCKNDTICQYPTDCGPDPLTLCATATDDCTAADQLKYTFFVDVNNNGTNDLQGSGSCVTLTKALGLSYGRHMITWAVEDICGNVKTCSKIFIVKDCKKPTPVSKLMTIELMPNNCQATLEAVKVNNFSWDNCTPMANLRFRLAKSGEYKADMTLAEVLALNDYVIFTAGELGTQTIGLFVIDADNNWDYVETFIVVQSNMNPLCGGGTGTAAVSGTIQTEAKENVDKVDVKVNGTNKSTTDAQGFFNFLLNKNVSYTVAPEKLIDPRNGVTTADLVAINKHILAVDPLSSPYRRIAADINSDGKISTSDMVELRKLILFINDNFTSNTSWKMVDKSYSFKTTTPEKESYPLNVTINPLQTAASANFVAVKIGDVNGSAKANNLLGDASDRGAGTLVFDVTDASLVAGETKTVEFKAQDIANINAYQFTMNFDKEALEVVSVAGLNESNFGLSLLSEGVITTSNDAVAADQVIAVTFKAKQATQLSNALSIGSRYTAAEAYTVSGDKYDVALSFNGTIAGSFQLLQNQPNPFNGKTVIGMVFPEATAATMTIFDATGRTLKVIQGDYAKGYNEVTIDQADLKATGILSYRLTTDKFSATKQMIIAE